MAPKHKQTDPLTHGDTDVFSRLDALIYDLRSESGCPWDREQTPQKMAVYLIEEMHELIEAIAADHQDHACEELGDVLFLLFFIARIYAENNGFTIADAAEKSIAKMIFRHPHVFGQAVAQDSQTVRQRWLQLKRQEKRPDAAGSILDSIPPTLPALMRAYRVSERTAKTGFDWPDIDGVIAKTHEEWQEFTAELNEPHPVHERLSMEFGDLLFTLVNIARFAGIHPETALNQATRKFEARFRMMENSGPVDGLDPEKWDQLWHAAKTQIDSTSR